MICTFSQDSYMAILSKLNKYLVKMQSKKNNAPSNFSTHCELSVSNRFADFRRAFTNTQFQVFLNSHSTLLLQKIYFFRLFPPITKTLKISHEKGKKMKQRATETIRIQCTWLVYLPMVQTCLLIECQVNYLEDFRLEIIEIEFHLVKVY